MNTQNEMENPAACGCWSQVVASIVEQQLRLLNAQCQVCLDIAGELFRIPDALRLPSQAQREKLEQLEEQAAERIRRGLAPPREIYELPYRDRINWSAFPEWARPSDPELFRDCPHEG